MNLKKDLKSKRGQAVVEYIVSFIVLAVGIIIIFGGFNPENLGIKSGFEHALDNAINQINRP